MVECLTRVAVVTVGTVRSADAKKIHVDKCAVGAETVKQLNSYTTEASSECQRGLNADNDPWTMVRRANAAGDDERCFRHRGRAQ